MEEKDKEECPWSPRLFEPRRPHTAAWTLITQLRPRLPQAGLALHITFSPNLPCTERRSPAPPRVPAAFADATVEPCASQLCEDSHPLTCTCLPHPNILMSEVSISSLDEIQLPGFVFSTCRMKHSV